MKARILPISPSSIQEAASLLRCGEVVGMPTETVYGLAGNALDEQALARIFAAKERPTFDPLIVHVALDPARPRLKQLESAGLVDLSRFAPESRRKLEGLLERCWPGPLTIVLPKTSKVPDLATSGLSSVALRMPSHPAARALIEATGVPLAAPSANRFGRISPTRAEHVMQELGDRIPLILDAGASQVGVESTVVAADPSGTLTLLRPGGTPVAEIEELIGAPLQRVSQAASGGAAPSPGMLESHYAPRKPLALLSRPLDEMDDDEVRRVLGTESVGLLLQGGDLERARERLAGLGLRPELRVLSPRGDLGEAARNLFAHLRELDRSDVERIFAEPCTDTRGLGHAISDRLTRAQKRR